MTNPTTDSQLDDLIADVIRREEAGDVVDRAALLAEHPDLADELRAFFSDRDEMARLARPVTELRRPLPARVRYFGDYELLEEIGAGGMGLVYRARQSTLNRIVAVKMIAAGHLASEDDLRRFRTEAEAAASLQHPGIVTVHEVGVNDGRHYFSMDYIEGRTLGELVRDHPLPAREAARYTRDVAEAVHAAHRQGILHRDLKPSNVLVDGDDRVRVTDFGLAVRWESDPSVTGTGSVLGTPSYMPPEQAQGKRGLIVPSSDVYAMGAVLYQLLTGRPPFQAENAVETLRQVVEREPVSPRAVNPTVPRDLETICLKCLEKEPHRRYATANGMADDLGRYLDGKPIHARPVGRVTKSWKWCRRHPAVAGLSTTLALVLVWAFVVTVVLWQRAVENQLQAEANARRAETLAGELSESLSAVQARDRRIRGLVEQITGADGDILPASLTALGDGDEDLRHFAIAVIGKSAPRNEATCHAIATYLTHPDRFVRDRVHAILRESGEFAVPALIGEIEDGDEARATTAIRLLEEIGPDMEQVMPVLEQAATKSASPSAWHAERMIRRVDPDRATELFGPIYDPAAVQLGHTARQNARPGDRTQWGGSPERDNVYANSNVPTSWKIDGKNSVNVKWSIEIGSQTYATPAVANGKIFIGTNNGAGFLKRYPNDVDLGVLLCLDEKTGQFLWQYSSPKLPQGRVNDWPEQGIPSTPYCDGDRVWIVTNRCKVVCLDADGFRDGENDGPFEDEEVVAENEADVIWELDMIEELDVFPHNMTLCSPTSADGLLFVNTCNGVGEGHLGVPVPRAPSFLAIDRDTGKVVWEDSTPFDEVLHGAWASPCYGVFDGQPQVIFPGGDGWLYSFDPKGDGKGGSKLLWRFDCNPKESQWQLGGRGTRNSCIGFPAIYDGRLFYAVGQDPEHGEGVGHVWCIDPTKRGDVSPELVVDAEGVPMKDPNTVNSLGIPKNHSVVPNPKSAAVWHYGGIDKDGSVTGKKDEYIMRRTLSTPTVKEGLMIVPDLGGWVHCLDVKTGKRFWEGDTFGEIWGSAAIVGDHVYIGDQDGDMHVFPLSPDPFRASNGDTSIKHGRFEFRDLWDDPKRHNVFPNSIYSTPIVANGVLYVTTRSTLYAIAFPEKPIPKPKP